LYLVAQAVVAAVRVLPGGTRDEMLNCRLDFLVMFSGARCLRGGWVCLSKAHNRLCGM
jgi:hypothetical protein